MSGALIGTALVVAAIMLSLRFSVPAATLRAAVEAVLMLCGLASASLVWTRFRQARRVSDLLLTVAVLMLTLEDLAAFAAPAILGSHRSAFGALPSLTARLAVGLAFAAAALVPRGGWLRARWNVAALAIVTVSLAAVAIARDGQFVWFHATRIPETTGGRTVALTVPAICLLCASAIGFVRTSLREGRGLIGAMLGASSILIAAAWTYDLLLPDLTAGSVSGRECLRAGGYGLILTVALMLRAQQRREETDAVIARERRRFTRELHDGIAQDLALIAAHAGLLARELGDEHPVVVAARRALAASRGVLIDLSAADAPTVTEALRAVARELSSRYGVRITVDVSGEDLPRDEREAIVRIAREAIVNAAQHGRAANVAVSLQCQNGKCVLRIGDDGRGPGDDACDERAPGFGLRAMRERAESIGGQLITRQPGDGGMEVEVVVS